MLTARTDQANYRQSITYFDQHGRPWLTVIDTQTRTLGSKPSIAPCTPFMPQGWSAPLDVPQKYLRIPEGSIGRIEIDYDQWIADAREAERDREDNIRVAAMAMYGQGSAAILKNPTPELLNYIGRGPIPVLFVQAAKSNKNSWILGKMQPNGLPWPVPKWAEPLLDQLLPMETTTRVDDDMFLDEEFADEAPFIDESAEEPADPSDPLVEQYNEMVAAGIDPAEAREAIWPNATMPAPVFDASRYEGDEDQHDPESLGGRTVPVRPNRQPTRPKGRR